MKNILLLLLICCSTVVQSQTTFTKQYNLPLLQSQLISPLKGSGYYFCGSEFVPDQKMIVGRIDSLGNLLWAKRVEGFTISNIDPVDMTTIANGNAVILFHYYDSTKYNSLVLCMDSLGNNVFCKRYTNIVTNDTTNAENIIADETGFTIAIEVESFVIDETHFLKADSSGNKIVTASLQNHENYIFKNSENKYLACSGTGSIISVYDYNFVYEKTVFSVGDNLSGPIQGILEPRTKTYMIYGSEPGTIGLLDSSFEYIWNKQIELDGQFYSLIIDAAVQIDFDKIAFYAYTIDGFAFHPLIFEMDLQGNILNTKYLPVFTCQNYLRKSEMVFKDNLLAFCFNDSGSSFTIFSVDTTLSQFCNAVDTSLSIIDDANFISTIIPYDHPQNTDDLQDDSVLISDLIINYSDCIDTTVGISDNPYNYIEHDIFPNPFTNTLTISTNDHHSGEIEIYDLQHRKLFSEHFENSLIMNTENLVPGIYIYEIYSKNQMIGRGKVIKN